MFSLESLQATPNAFVLVDDQTSSPRISFSSSEFLDESNFISICPNPALDLADDQRAKATAQRNADFEFLSVGKSTNMLPADQLFREGKLLPCWQTDKLNRIATSTPDKNTDDRFVNNKDDENRRINWFIDDDPSPRPPKCTVLWKELLRMKKHNSSSALSLSASSSSSSSSSKGSSAAADVRVSGDERNKDKCVKRKMKKGGNCERTSRAANVRIRPVINVPICSNAKNSALSPIFAFRRGRLER